MMKPTALKLLALIVPVCLGKLFGANNHDAGVEGGTDSCSFGPLVVSDDCDDSTIMVFANVHPDGNSVDFLVKNIGEKTKCALATDYDSSDGSNRCDRIDNLAVGNGAVITALCGTDMKAEIDVYDFAVKDSIAPNVPETCKLPKEHTKMCKYQIDCSTPPAESCEKQNVGRTCDDLSSLEKTLYSQDYSNAEEAHGWLNGKGEGGFLKLGAGKQVTRHFVIPDNTAHVTVEFGITESSFITALIGTQMTPLGTSSLPSGSFSGTVGVYVAMEQESLKRIASLVIPKEHFADGNLFFGLMASEETSIDNFSLTVYCENQAVME